MAEDLKVVLKKSDNLSFGFSLLGTAGLPHVIYDIMENSPAAECGEVSSAQLFFFPYLSHPIYKLIPSSLIFIFNDDIDDDLQQQQRTVNISSVHYIYIYISTLFL